MQESEKLEIAQKNVALMDKMNKSIRYFIAVNALLMVIDLLTSGGTWFYWVIGIWGAVLAVEWVKVQDTIRQNRSGVEEKRQRNKVRQEMSRID